MTTMSIVERLRREADWLHKALRSTNPAEAEAAAERFRILNRFKESTPSLILQAGKSVKHRDALQVVALEAGHPGWDAFMATAVAAPARKKTREQVDHEAIAAGMIAWRADAYMHVTQRMQERGVLATLEEFYRALTQEIVATGTAHSLTEVESHIERYQNIHLWIERHLEALAPISLAARQGDEIGFSGELLAHLAASPYSVTALKAPGVPWKTFDIHQIAGDALMTHWQWRGPRVWRAADRTVEAEHTATPLLSPDARVNATTWYYAPGENGGLVKLTRATAEALFYGRDTDLPPGIRADDDQIVIAGVVVLTVDGSPRWIERVRAARLSLNPDPDGPSPGWLDMEWPGMEFRADRGPAFAWDVLASEILRRAKAPAGDVERLALYLSKNKGGNLPVQTSIAMGNRTTSDMHRDYADMSLWKDRSSTLWDLPFGRPVPPGMPLAPTWSNRETTYSPPTWLSVKATEVGTEAPFRVASRESGTLPSLDRILERNARLEQHRRALLDLAEETDALAPYLCQCGSPGCHNRTPEGFPFSRVLESLAKAWTQRGLGISVVDKIPPMAADTLGPVLTAIGDDFELWELVTCHCDNAQCASRTPRTAPPAVKLQMVANGWGLAGGCRHQARITAEAASEAAETNRDLVDSLSSHIDKLTSEQLRKGMEMYRMLQSLPWHLDVNTRIAHCLRDYWGEDVWDQFGSTVTAAVAWLKASKFDGTPEEREYLERALNMFVCGVAVDGIAHPSVTEPFLAPFAEYIDLASVRSDAQELAPVWRQLRSSLSNHAPATEGDLTHAG